MKLTHEEASKVMIAAGLTPLVEYPGSQKPWLCRCNACGNEVTPQRQNINTGFGGCQACASSGYDPTKTGFFYIAHMDDIDLTGFGITNDANRRLGDYKREGTLTGFDAVFSGTGQEIALFEAELKVLVREMGEVDRSRPAGFKTESLAGDWVQTLIERAERAGLTVV